MCSSMFACTQAWGTDLTLWSTENMIDAGSVMASIPATEMAQMNITLDVLDALGDLEVFTQPQVLLNYRL